MIKVKWESNPAKMLLSHFPNSVMAELKPFQWAATCWEGGDILIDPPATPLNIRKYMLEEKYIRNFKMVFQHSSSLSYLPLPVVGKDGGY